MTSLASGILSNITYSYYGQISPNGNQIIAKTQAAYQALLSAYYYSSQYCVPNTNGTSTTSYYNSTSDQGMFVPSTNTSSYNLY